jgi:hypothetical protein
MSRNDTIHAHAKADEHDKERAARMQKKINAEHEAQRARVLAELAARGRRRK